MQARRWLMPTVLLLLPLFATARAEDGPHWEVSLDNARRIAAQSNRLVLIHFWARWCGPCRNLEANVFKQPGVGAAMEAHYVLVKINVDTDDGHTLGHAYNVETLPTDVIITPTNRVIAKLPCPASPPEYLAQLDRTATIGGFGAGPTNAVAQNPGISTPIIENPYRPGTPVASPNAMSMQQRSPMANQPGAMQPAPYGPLPGGPGMNGPGMNGAVMVGPGAPAAAPPGDNDRWTGVRDPAGPGPNAPPQVAGMTPPQIPAPNVSQAAMMAGYHPAVIASAPPVKQTGLDGFCAVTLVERSRTAPQDPRCWVQGDARWGAVHRGITYLFAGPEEQKKFLADPDRYSPALSGNDPVLAFDRNRLQQGHREFGQFYDYGYGNRIYLFTNSETLDKFRQNPRHYAEDVRQAESNNHGDMR